MQTDYLISTRKLDQVIINKKHKWKPKLKNQTKQKNKKNSQWTCWLVDFAVPTDHKVKVREDEKRGRYLDLARELKDLWNVKVTVIPIVIGALGMILKGGVGVETIQTTALLRSARILRRVLETWGDLLSLELQWKTSGVKKS